jgi:uncharacterized protein YkwD
MHRTVRHKQALGWLAALSSAALVSAGCAGAGGAAGAPGRLRAPVTVSNGVFTPAGAAAASYGPDAGAKCSMSGAFRSVLDELTAVAKRAGKPAPVADGRVCAVAESFLGWAPEARPRPAVLELASQWYGLTSTVQPPIVAELDTDDPKQIAERVVQAVGTPALNAVRPLIGMATVATERARRGGGTNRSKISVVLLDGGVEIDPLPRRLDAGQQAALTGRFAGELASPKVTVSDALGHVTTAENPGGKDFAIDVKCGDKPGQIRVEVRGERAGQSGVLANFPVACATQPAASIAVAAEPWPADAVQQGRKVLELVNEERSAAGLKPLVWDEEIAQVARAIAESLKGGGNGADVRERLKAAGIASPVILQSLAVDRSAQRAQERLANSPTNRSNILSTDVTNGGVGLFSTKDAQNAPLVYLAEIFVKELPPMDVEQARTQLREAVAQKRKDARASALQSDPVLEEVAQKYAQALAAGGGALSKEDAAGITEPLNAAFKTVNMISGAKQEPLDFAEEPQVVTPGKSLGVGLAQGRHEVLGRNASYVVIMVGTPRDEGKAARPKKKRK